MSEEEQDDRTLEAALQLHVSRRCERAYVHELRNALQPLQSGIEVLLKMAGGKTSSVTPERVTTIVRKSMVAHEQALERTVVQLVLKDESREVVDLSVAVRETVQFLNNDATVRGLALRVGNVEPLSVLARSGRIRLVLLGTTLRVIDSLPAGAQVTFSTQIADESAMIDLALTGNSPSPNDSLWQDDWVLRALRNVAAREDGQIELRRAENADPIVRMVFERARRSE